MPIIKKINDKTVIVAPTDSELVSSAHVIQEEGVDLPQRQRLNFIGDSVTVTDNSGANTTDVTIVGGGGSGGINHIENPDMEVDTDGYVTYSDGVGTVPIDGTLGAASNFLISRNTASPLRGDGDLQFTKNAANARGEGASYEFNIDRADQTSVLRVSFDYKTGAGYQDADITVYVYDITNGSLIELSQRELLASASGQFLSEFQTSSNSTSYRLIWHVSTTNTTSYIVNLDNIQVGPREIARGPIITTPIPFEGSVTNLVIGSETFSQWREGKHLQVLGTVSVTGASGGAITINMPPGLSIDQSIVIGGAVGVAHTNDGSAGGNDYQGTVRVNNSTSLVINAEGGSPSTWGGSFPHTWANGDTLEVFFTVPVLGWSSNTKVSGDFGNREIVARYNDNGGQSITAGVTDISFGTKEIDTTNSWSGNSYTVPESGNYRFKGFILLTTAPVAPEVRLYVNGVYKKIVGLENNTNPVMFDGEVTVSAGDVVSIRMGQTVTLSSGVGLLHYIDITRLATPQTLFGSEVVALSAFDNSAQSIPNSSETTVTFNDVVDDTHGSFDGAIHTIAVSGRYRISYNISIDGPFNAGEVLQSVITLNGTGSGDRIFGTRSDQEVTNDIATTQGSFIYPFSKGDQIRLRIFQASGGSSSLVGTSAFNNLSIEKIG